MGWLKRLLGTQSDQDPQGVSTTAPRDLGADAFRSTETNLEIADIQIGDGDPAAKGQKVTVHYTGWLTSGKRFDSSAVKRKPFTFTLGARRVIEGREEGVTGMQVGGIRQLRIPPALGYGAAGHPPVIPRNATLVFEIELLSVEA